jgi:oligoribonuclease
MSQDKQDGLLWIDIETTGLNPRMHDILEVELRITKMDAGKVLAAKHVVIDPITDDENDLQISMYALGLHANNNLLKETCTTVAKLQQEAWLELKTFLDTYTNHYVLHPAGSLVHFDINFLDTKMPGLLDDISHQYLDVSSIRMFMRQYNPEQLDTCLAEYKRKPTHRTTDCLDRDMGEYAMLLRHTYKPTAVEGTGMDHVGTVKGRVEMGAES